MSDNVNHPKHYEGATSIECIEAMIVAFGKQAVYDFCKCNNSSLQRRKIS